MPELQPSPVLRMPQVNVTDDLDSTLPLEHTTVSAHVTGPLASVSVSQRFGNPLNQPAELEYLFPLPEEAAIIGFELRIGQRTILGDLQESEAARTSYEEARRQGQRAGLFEQRRPNLFAVQLANVQPGETIQATMRYQQRLKFEEEAGGGAGRYEFLYPMGITPKYDSPAHPDEGQGVHAPIAHKSDPLGLVDISVSIDAGLPVGDPRSPSHELEITRLDERRVQVRLPGEAIPDHDFILRYALTSQQLQAASWSSKASGPEIFLATLVPPRQEAQETAMQPREFIFVLDRSGSMTGEPIRQARNALRACLRALDPADTFRILLFDNELEWFQPEPAPVNQAQVELADRYLDQVDGRGGTEIVAALESVLSLPADPRRARFVLFLTDGAVSAETRTVDQIRQKLGAARLFTFGIGSSVNRALLSRMASLGRGRATFLQLDEDIEGAIIRFQDSVSFPALTDLTLEWENGKAWDIYPARLPDLYYGQPLEISGRMSRNGENSVRLTLRGKRGSQPVEVRLALREPAARDTSVERIWARARVDDLFEQAQLDRQRADALRQEIVGVAMEFGLVTPYTSFVAVDREATNAAGQPRFIRVAQPLPAGVSADVFLPGGGLQHRAAMITGGVMPAAFVQPSPAARAVPPPQPAQAKGGDTGSLVQKFIKRKARPGMDEFEDWATPSAPLSEPSEEPAKPSAPQDRESVLRLLARTQKLDGSWNNNGEWTAAALLAFLRAGHTTRSGSFRQVLRRATRWLVENKGAGLESFLRAFVLQELARVTGDENDRAAAQAARLALLLPSGILESAALGQPVPPLAAIHSLDDLRLAAILSLGLPVPAELLRGPQAELAQVWAAALAK